VSEAPFAGRALHFVGIGGAGMSGLALVANRLGADVTGSDRFDSNYCERLRAAGIEPRIGHDAANVPAGAEVVVSTAIAEDNPELTAARSSGARVLHRADLLAEVSSLKRSIAISGTHGKTTTAGMAAHALVACGRDPAYLVGGELRATETNAAWGEGEWIVIEADESDRSFLKLSPDVAVVTNVELDHHSTFRSLSDLERSVAEFAQGAETRIAGEGVVLPEPVVRFGIADRAAPGAPSADALLARDVELVGLGSRFTVDGVHVELSVPGEHNVLNALAALAAVREAGLPIAEAADAMGDFRGAARRFEPHGATPSGARVYDDYAHHPTEVRATLEAARALDPGRLVACFQPHLFSRTRALARDFGRALALADLVVVVDVYPARELPEDYPGVSGWLVAAATADAAGGRPVYWLPRLEEAERFLAAELGEDDVLLTLGAGDVDAVARAVTTVAGDPGTSEPAAEAAS
jgi:UDP-N-acetylmuramate--alanine ligase